MNLNELPSAATIRKYQSGAKRATIEKNGISVTKPEAKLNSQWMDITPEMAGRWLKNNFRNRPMSDDTIMAYARDMINGTWRATHQGIAFNDQDQLIDGQHRLAAIVKANKTIRMMVTFGLESKIDGTEMTVMDCVDRGRPRSVADQLKIQHGIKNGSTIAGVCTVIAHLCFGERVRKLSVGQALQIYRSFESEVDWVIAHRSKENGLRSVGVLGAVAFVLMADEASFSFNFEARKMLESLVAGIPAGQWAVLQELRNFLTGEQASLIIASMNKGLAELVVHAFHCQLEGGKFSNSPEEWLKSVVHYRTHQQERVDQIAALFKLPALEQPKLATTIIYSEPATSPTTAKGRPSLEKIMAKVEAHFQISKFIITGKGNDIDLKSARIVFVYLARSYGHTGAVTGGTLKRTEDQIKDLTLPLNAMNTKQRNAVEVIKAKL